MKTKSCFSISAIAIALFLVTKLGFAQTPLAPYGEVSFIKVSPGMNENYLSAMQIFKKTNNSRKTAKSISSWQLYRRVYPIDKSTLDFDYATVEVFASGKEMQARKNYASYNAPFKELSAKEIVDAVGSFSNIRTIVARDLYTFRFGAGGGTKPGDYVMLTRVKASSGNLDAYEKTLESLKPVIEEAIKAGKLKSWNVWKRTLATNVAGASDYTIGFAFNTLDEALSYASGKVEISADFKKVFPKEEYSVFRSKQVSLRELVSQEIWELVDMTN